MNNKCECGCGGLVNIARENNKLRGWIKGKPLRFITHHNFKGRKTNRVKGPYGYIMATCLSHPRTTKWGYVMEHILITEKSLGKYLPPKAEVHHVNGDRADNQPENLVICDNPGYHRFLHRRQEAFNNCGHANWLRCRYCKENDDPSNMYVWFRGVYGYQAHHRECNRKYGRSKYIPKARIRALGKE